MIVSAQRFGAHVFMRDLLLLISVHLMAVCRIGVAFRFLFSLVNTVVCFCCSARALFVHSVTVSNFSSLILITILLEASHSSYLNGIDYLLFVRSALSGRRF